MPITNFVLSFKPQTNQFLIQAQVQGSALQPLPVNSIEEFIAVALVLNRGNAVVLPDGTLQSRG